MLLGIVGEGTQRTAYFRRQNKKWEIWGVNITFSVISERQKINNTGEKVKEFLREFLLVLRKYISVYKNSDYIQLNLFGVGLKFLDMAFC